MELKITCIPGDGIGPEIVTEAKKVLNKVAEVYGHKMNFTDILPAFMKWKTQDQKLQQQLQQLLQLQLLADVDYS